MREALLLLLTFMTFAVIAQNPNLHYGGNAFVDIGPDALNGVRTIELWFKLDSNFHESSTLPQTLIARNTTWCNSCDEVQLVLLGGNLNPNNSGQLRFGWQNSNGNNPQMVFSDTNAWYADQWYHVAGVIDPITGMRLYIDGKQQSNTLTSQTNAVTYSDTTTYIGKWGTSQINPRYFNGKIENVRLSSIARYTSNFTPECANDTVDIHTQGIWFFNHGSGFIAYDSSGNQYDGSISNAVWSSDSFCIADDPHDNPSFVRDLKKSDFPIRIFPNPSKDRLLTVESEGIVEIRVFGIGGTLVYIHRELNTNRINLSQLEKGTYLVMVTSDQGYVSQVPLVLL